MSAHTTLQSRLTEALREKGAKPAHLASAVGATRATVSDWVNGKTKAISPDYLFAVADFLGVYPDWLAHGKGPRRMSDAAANPTQRYLPTYSTGIKAVDGGRYVQSYELWRNEVAQEIRFMSVPQDWLEKNGYSVDQLKSMNMPDDSQAPRVRRGDTIVVNIEWGTILQNDCIYAVKLGGQYTLRRIAYRSNGCVVLSCANGNYADETIGKTEISNIDVLGQAVRFEGSFEQ